MLLLASNTNNIRVGLMVGFVCAEIRMNKQIDTIKLRKRMMVVKVMTRTTRFLWLK